eukprot:38446-Rhodomonas_salina.2
MPLVCLDGSCFTAPPKKKNADRAHATAATAQRTGIPQPTTAAGVLLGRQYDRHCLRYRSEASRELSEWYCVWYCSELV